jgi:hypothetical protein
VNPHIIIIIIIIIINPRTTATPELDRGPFFCRPRHPSEKRTRRHRWTPRCGRHIRGARRKPKRSLWRPIRPPILKVSLLLMVLILDRPLHRVWDEACGECQKPEQVSLALMSLLLLYHACTNSGRYTFCGSKTVPGNWLVADFDSVGALNKPVLALLRSFASGTRQDLRGLNLRPTRRWTLSARPPFLK